MVVTARSWRSGWTNIALGAIEVASSDESKRALETHKHHDEDDVRSEGADQQDEIEHRHEYKNVT
jgi:hypothetical protein